MVSPFDFKKAELWKYRESRTVQNLDIWDVQPSPNIVPQLFALPGTLVSLTLLNSPTRLFLLFGFDAYPCLFIRTLPHLPSDRQVCWHTKTDFDCICPFWLDAAWLTQHWDTDGLLCSLIESSSWKMTLANVTPRPATWSHSMKSHLSDFLVGGNRLCLSTLRSAHLGKDSS